MCTSCNWEEWLEQAEEVLADVDELPERAADFADSVREKIEGMVSWVEENEHVTEKMQTALENTAMGVGRWQS